MKKYLFKDSLSVRGIHIEEVLEEGRLFRCKKYCKDGSKPMSLIVRASSQREKKESVFQKEFDLVKSFKFEEKIRSIPVYYELVIEKNVDFILLSDENYHLLTTLLQNGKIETNGLVLGLIECIVDLHNRQVVVQDIAPNNIFVSINPKTSKIEGVRFGGLQKFSGYSPFSHSLYCYKYISPEQTGRLKEINIDTRSDLYMLGIVLWEIYSEGRKRPFEGSDRLELLHKHMALEAKPLHEGNKNISKQLSSIVGKLLKKQKIDRYQTIEGVRTDLRKYMEGSDKFIVGEGEKIHLIQPSSRFYAREKTICMIKKIVKEKFNMSFKPNVGIFLSGVSGVGKSKLVNFVFGKSNNIYITGNFFENVHPLNNIQQTFNDIYKVLKLLGKKEVDLFGEKLRNELSDEEIHLIRPFIKLENLVPNMPPKLEVPREIGDSEKFNVIKIIVCKVFNEFFTRCKNVVIFWDNMQWAHPLYMNVLEDWMNSTEFNVILIGCFRPLQKNHFVKKMIERAKDYAKILEIELLPLREDSIQDFLVDSLNSTKEDVEDLSSFFFAKTEGIITNAFELFKYLTKFGLIYRNKENKIEWKMNDILKHFSKIKQIRDTTRRNIFSLNNKSMKVLEIVSLMRKESFPIDAVAKMVGMSEDETYKLVQQMLDNFFVRNSDKRYTFAHHILRDMCYENIPVERRKMLYLSMGKSMKELGLTRSMVFYFGNAEELLREQTDNPLRMELAELNLQYAKEFRTVMSRDEAYHHTLQGFSWLKGCEEEKCYRGVFFELLLEKTRLDFLLNKEIDNSKRLKSLLSKVSNKTELSEVYSIFVSNAQTSRKHKEAVDLATAFLNEMNFHLPPTTQVKIP